MKNRVIFTFRRLGERKSYLGFAGGKIPISTSRGKRSYLSFARKKVLSRLRVVKSPISASRGKQSYLDFAWKKILFRLFFHAVYENDFGTSVFVNHSCQNPLYHEYRTLIFDITSAKCYFSARLKPKHA